MKTRDAYVTDLKAQLDRWNADMARWEAQARSAQADLKKRYEKAPVVGSLLRLSSGGKISDLDVALTPPEAAAALTSAGIAFIVLDTRRASAELTEYVQSKIALRRVAEEDGRIFYEVME